MSQEKNACCQQSCCGSSVWGAAVAVILVIVVAAGLLDWRAQERLYVPYGTETNAKNAFRLQEIQYGALSEQIAKDPKFFEKVTAQANGQAAQAAGGQQDQQGEEPQAQVKKAAPEQLKTAKEGTYVEGAADARFTVYEFSDLECPYCKRQHDQGTIETVQKQFPGEVNRVFKVSPLPFHPQARAAATAVLCAGEIGGSAAYYKGLAAIFAAGDERTGQFEESVPAGLAKTIKIDAKKFDTCYKSDKYKAAIDASIAQGAALGVQGTPGNVIVDNETGNYVLLAGAFPAEYFAKAIEQLKAAK